MFTKQSSQNHPLPNLNHHTSIPHTVVPNHSSQMSLVSIYSEMFLYINLYVLNSIITKVGRINNSLLVVDIRIIYTS